MMLPISVLLLPRQLSAAAANAVPTNLLQLMKLLPLHAAYSAAAAELLVGTKLYVDSYMHKLVVVL